MDSLIHRVAFNSHSKAIHTWKLDETYPELKFCFKCNQWWNRDVNVEADISRPRQRQFLETRRLIANNYWNCSLCWTECGICRQKFLYQVCSGKTFLSVASAWRSLCIESFAAAGHGSKCAVLQLFRAMYLRLLIAIFPCIAALSWPFQNDVTRHCTPTTNTMRCKVFRKEMVGLTWQLLIAYLLTYLWLLHGGKSVTYWVEIPSHWATFNNNQQPARKTR